MSARDRFPGIYFLEQHNGGYGAESATILNVVDDLEEQAAARARLPVGLWLEIRAERARAHRKHGATSMESCAPLADRRFRVLAEEVGEVAKALNDAEHADPMLIAAEVEAATRYEVRAELIQVAAMAVAWIAALDGEALT